MGLSRGVGRWEGGCEEWMVQYDGSKDDLDWRIDFKYHNFICIIKYLRSRLI